MSAARGYRPAMAKPTRGSSTHTPSRGDQPKAGKRAAPSRRGAEVKDFPDGPPDESGLTPRQRRVLEVIRNSVDRRGYPPSLREIGEAVGLTSPSSVSHQLSALERKGYLRKDPNRPRAIEVVSPDTASEGRGYRGSAGAATAGGTSGASGAAGDETGSGDAHPA